ncbi:MAG: hypothetical protein PUP92_03650 [Rhizonema sp. PD38]|nr:hypothetical protein [Rhizonema sp. PD38]
MEKMASDRISQDFASPDLCRDFEQIVIPNRYRHLQSVGYYRNLAMQELDELVD